MNTIWRGWAIEYTVVAGVLGFVPPRATRAVLPSVKGAHRTEVIISLFDPEGGRVSFEFSGVRVVAVGDQAEIVFKKGAHADVRKKRSTLEVCVRAEYPLSGWPARPQTIEEQESLAKAQQDSADSTQKACRPIALLAANVCAVMFSPAVLEPKGEEFRVWVSDDKSQASAITQLEAINPIDITPDQLERVTLLVHQIGQVTDGRTDHLRIAGQWFIWARTEPTISTERFIGMFICLEALVQSISAKLGSDKKEQFKELRKTVSQHAPHLDKLTAELENRYKFKSLQERFALLAETHFSAQAKEDVDAFSRLAAARGRILHGGADFRHDAHAEGSEVTSLAFRYLDACVRAYARDNPSPFQIKRHQ